MQHLEVSGAVRPIYGSLGVKGLRNNTLKLRELPPPETKGSQHISWSPIEAALSIFNGILSC